MGSRIAILSRETAILELNGLPVPPPEGFEIWAENNPPRTEGHDRQHLLRANHVGSLEALRPFHQIELDRFAFIEGPITVLLDSGKVYEYVLPSGPLDEAVTFRPVKPLHSSLFSHKRTPFRDQLSASGAGPR